MELFATAGILPLLHKDEGLWASIRGGELMDRHLTRSPHLQILPGWSA
jgi:hypothetical protein